MIPTDYLNQIVTGDSRELSKRIPDASVDLVFSDPPYPREFLPLYGWIAEEAARVLKPGGWCLVMCGGLYLNQIFRLMDDHLEYFWKYEVSLGGKGLTWPAGPRGRMPIVTQTKAILAYSKGADATPRTPTLGLFAGTGSDKRYHAWGQDEASTRYYIDCFSSHGDVVFEPFTGGGTTPSMCIQLGRQYIAFENDPSVADTARERVRNTQMPLFTHEPEQGCMALQEATPPMPTQSPTSLTLLGWDRKKENGKYVQTVLEWVQTGLARYPEKYGKEPTHILVAQSDYEAVAALGLDSVTVEVTAYLQAGCMRIGGA